MNISNKGLELIKKWESFVPNVYLCPAGLPTIGYGHVVKNGESFSKITEEEAHELLLKDIKQYEEAINKKNLNLTQSQFDALCSFVYNVGATAFSNSTMLKYMKNDNFLKASKEFKKWNKATVNGVKVPLNGLTNRRLEESELFNED